MQEALRHDSSLHIESNVHVHGCTLERAIGSCFGVTNLFEILTVGEKPRVSVLFDISRTSCKLEKGFFMLKGILHCKNCGAIMYPILSASKTEWYSCRGRYQKNYGIPCEGNRMVDGREIDDFVWNVIKELILENALKSEVLDSLLTVSDVNLTKALLFTELETAVGDLKSNVKAVPAIQERFNQALAMLENCKSLNTPNSQIREQIWSSIQEYIEHADSRSKKAIVQRFLSRADIDIYKKYQHKQYDIDLIISPFGTYSALARAA